MDNKQRALEINTILAGKYIVLDVLGEGGFGITYLGLDTTLERKIAIKEYFPTVFVYGESRSTSTLYLKFLCKFSRMFF